MAIAAAVPGGLSIRTHRQGCSPAIDHALSAQVPTVLGPTRLGSRDGGLACLGSIATTVALAAAFRPSAARRGGSRPRTILGPWGVGAPIPEPGESASFFGVDKDIPRQRFYNFGLWDKHRKNPERYARWAEGIFLGSTMPTRLKYLLLGVALVTGVGYAYNTLLALKLGWPVITLPLVPFTISSFPLGLLLSNRLNGSSNRYLEGRLIWGDIVNTCRDLMMMSHCWTSTDQFNVFAAWVSLYPAALQCILRRPEEHDLKVELMRAIGAKSPITEKQIDLCVNRPPGVIAPMYILHRLKQQIQSFDLGDPERRAMEMGIGKLVADIGACERLVSTPMPVGFTIHTARFLLFWVGLLPFALQTELGSATVITMVFLAFALLGVEDGGLMLEEPFCVLPLEAIVSKVSTESRKLQAVNIKEAEAAVKDSMKPGALGKIGAKAGAKPKAKGK